ncbi:MAG: LacI family transcriptional regulator [Bifidobacteriaceae bacterium]|jgi:DNA-binding LacI/PurR family transcriptional regulator|nr:LacI family transcriptional regulator [Bifidobacteriaceae bacterium]MCI1979662.1 LacI family transcriptional regulator [Bifidobacteriaceae bacterium]
MKASIQDVARRAGVSVSTVSRSFTRPELVSEKTREKVMAIAETMDFQISRSATALKSGQSFRIALLLSGPVTTWFNSHVFLGLNSVLQQRGYDISIYTISTFEARKEFFSTLPVRRNADAVVVCSFNIKPSEVSRLRHMNVPVVGVNISDYNGFDAGVKIDDRESMKTVVRHLVSIGHRRIAYIRTTHDTPFTFSADERLAGFEQACKEAGEDVQSTVLHCPIIPNPINSAVSQILALDPTPTALCFQTDDLAVPVLYRLRRYGRTIPGDFSIVGFDDSTYTSAIGLTTLHQDPVEMGKRAADKILDLIATEHTDQPFETFSTQLMLRETTSPIAIESED